MDSALPFHLVGGEEGLRGEGEGAGEPKRLYEEGDTAGVRCISE